MSHILGYVTSWLELEAHLVLSNPIEAWRELVRTFGPGGKLHPRYFLEHRYHLIVEGILLLGIVYLLSQRRSSPKAVGDALSEQDINDLVADWQPAPLAPTDPIVQLESKVQTPVIESMVGSRATVNGKQDVLHLASLDFWGLSGHKDVLKAAKACVEYFGIGSCGPRGFYGTIQTHVDFEHHLAKFMGTEEAIVYSYDVSTIPSVLPAFASSKDVIVMDDAACWPLRNGAQLSRAKVLYFKHNDLEDLERVLRLVTEKARGKPLNRRFIVVEGLYQGTGDIAPLRGIYDLKQRYKFRVIVDETLSFGVLGALGRGACEAAGLQPGDAEIVTGSLGTGLSSVGGFCVGERLMVDHQRLSGSGYCFSASSPPVLSAAASETLTVFEGQSERILAALRSNARTARQMLHRVPGFGLIGRSPEDDESPVLVLRPLDCSRGLADTVARLYALRDRLLDVHGVLVAVLRPTNMDHKSAMQPALKVVVTAAHSRADLTTFAQALKTAASGLFTASRQ